MRECVITQESHGHYDILRLQGSLDSFSFPKLEKALNELRDQRRNCVVLDCSGLNYISSVAIGALIGFARRARQPLPENPKHHRIAGLPAYLGGACAPRGCGLEVPGGVKSGL
jgi:ABC-type transporter Mla MlaB component